MKRKIFLVGLGLAICAAFATCNVSGMDGKFNLPRITSKESAGAKKADSMLKKAMSDYYYDDDDDEYEEDEDENSSSEDFSSEENRGPIAWDEGEEDDESYDDEPDFNG